MSKIAECLRMTRISTSRKTLVYQQICKEIKQPVGKNFPLYKIQYQINSFANQLYCRIISAQNIRRSADHNRLGQGLRDALDGAPIHAGTQDLMYREFIHPFLNSQLRLKNNFSQRVDDFQFPG